MSLEENIEENIQLINKNGIFESRFGVFKILDYDLNLDERKLKFKKYDHVLCEDCNQEIEKFSFVCYNCYNKETDCNERNRMNHGVCKSCFASNTSYGCSICNIFKTIDYDLNLGERKEKYRNSNHILCENCYEEVDYYRFYCTYCYDKETDTNKKVHMKFGSKFEIFKTSDYDLHLEERKAKYARYEHILCEKCNREVNKRYYCTYCYDKETDIFKKNHMKFGSNFKIFNTFDYNLNLKERRAKYMNYDVILCEKCNQKIDKQNYHCTDCYSKETDIIKKGHIKFGSDFKFFNTFDYNLNYEERRAKYKKYDCIVCEKCNREINKCYDCYCTYCYDEETDINKKGHMKFGSNFGIFEKSDYNLNLEERRVKYENYYGILCEICHNQISKWDYHCIHCYNEETDVIKKGYMKFGSNFAILDCNLNLEERRAKYMNYYGILCEKCDNEVRNLQLYCTYCYNNKETDINKKCFMKYGPNSRIFSTLDYHLNLEERKTKYKNYDHIVCEKCNNIIDRQYYYCTYCYYYKEADVIEKFGSKLRIFNTFDYNLNLEERRAKYMNYEGILCEKCNNIIDRQYYYCTYCYYKETDVIKKCHMKFGSNLEIFNTLDYNLNLKERRAKYMNYDNILCEKCNREINKHYYYCTYCYYKETDAIKKSHMKNGFKLGIFNTFDYNLNLEERKAKYKKYDHIVCEKCNNEIDKQYYNCNYCYNNQMIINRCKVCFIGNNDDCCSFYEFKQFLENFSEWINENNVFIEPKVGISDYDLDEDDRRVKYKNFDYILCEKCDRKYHYNYCYECFDKEIRELKDCENFYFKVYKKETKELRELKELQSILIDYKNVYFELNSNLGIFKQIRQKFENTKYYVLDKKILINNIRYNGVHNCWRKLRSYCCDCYDGEIDIIEKKRMEFGKCKECLKIHEDLNGCLSCNPKHFQRDFDKWTSRNEVIDKLIQDNQNIVRKCGLLEWIPYYKFTNINYIAKGGFAKVYSAIWKDGPIKKWSQFSNNWKRNGSTTIVLKVLNNSENISEDFLNEIKFFNEVSGYMCIIKCFGITQDPDTDNNYVLVLQYMENGDLRKYLERTANTITWDQRLNKIYDICLALNNIHVHGLIHKDLHPGNIFIDSTFAYIGDFGFCMPANEILSNSTKKNIYGVMPYMAPEILRGKPHTLASDVYSLGVIINEIITVIPPFNNQPHDHYLVLDICRGLRPNIREETPTSLEKLIKKCWDANPENRPTSGEVFHTLSYHLNAYKGMPLKKLSYNFNEPSQPTNITNLLLKIQVNETRPRLSYNLNESINITNSLSKIQLDEIHPQAIYTSRLLNFQNLPEPINCPNRQEFISSRYKGIRTGQVNTLHSDECSDCIIMDID